MANFNLKDIPAGYRIVTDKTYILKRGDLYYHQEIFRKIDYSVGEMYGNSDLSGDIVITPSKFAPKENKLDKNHPPEGYVIVTNEDYVVRAGDIFYSSSTRMWNKATPNDRTIKQKNPEGTKTYATNQPIGEIEKKVINKTIGVAIPKGFKLIEKGSLEIITADSKYWRTHWPKHYEFETVTPNFLNAVGHTEYQANRDLKYTDKDYYFIKPIPRFPCDRPYPYGY